jgi:hypothetical protein
VFRLTPRQTSFFDDFERQSAYILRAAGLLHELIDDLGGRAAKARALKELEHEGDRITHAVVTRLNTTFVTPLDRQDIHRLITNLDDVLDFLDETATEFVIYRIGGPTSECRAMAQVILDTVGPMDRAVRCLRTLDPGFRAHAIEVHRHENRADELLRQSMAALFEAGADPIAVLKWTDIYRTMEGVTDRCEDVANAIEAIILKMG